MGEKIIVRTSISIAASTLPYLNTNENTPPYYQFGDSFVHGFSSVRPVLESLQKERASTCTCHCASSSPTPRRSSRSSCTRARSSSCGEWSVVGRLPWRCRGGSASAIRSQTCRRACRVPRVRNQSVLTAPIPTKKRAYTRFRKHSWSLQANRWLPPSGMKN